MIINIVVIYHSFSKLIISDRDSLFISKFWFLLFYFLSIKWRLSIAFYLETNGQIKRQNSMMEVYLRAFVNWKQSNWAKLLLMIEFAYNNAKNANTSHILFKLNYNYHLHVLFENDVNSHWRSCSTEKLAKELRDLISICQQNLLHVQEL